MEPLRRIRVQRRPLQSGIRESVLEAVLSGAVKPGQKIAVQPLADLLGVSITPVREALNALISEGVLDTMPGGTAVVPHVTRSALEQWLWLRRDIEGRLIGLGLQRRSAADTLAIVAIVESAAGVELVVEACASIIERLVAVADQQILLDNLRRVRNRCGAHLADATRKVAAESGSRFLRELQAAMVAGADSDARAAYARYEDRIDAVALSGVDGPSDDASDARAGRQAGFNIGRR